MIWEVLRLLSGIAVVLLSPVIGAVIGTLVILTELNESGFQKLGYHTVSEVLDLVTAGVEKLTIAWKRQPKV
jgi:hypothetical protein